ncbi:unnamed protein product, partial [Clonostachys rosea f. rosea IK726]
NKDKALLDRLAALRGSSPSTKTEPPVKAPRHQGKMPWPPVSKLDGIKHRHHHLLRHPHKYTRGTTLPLQIDSAGRILGVEKDDGKKTTKEVDHVIARFRDEIEVEPAIAASNGDDREDTNKTQEPRESSKEDSRQTSAPAANLDLPSVPQDLTSSNTPASPSSNTPDDITARLSALRGSSASPSLSIPSVPSSKSAKEPKQLTSRTNYTDGHMSSWCTVCLEDATLKCLGCDDGEPYCVRCWRKMHIGPAAAFDDRDHNAVYFARDGKKEKRVAIGA